MLPWSRPPHGTPSTASNLPHPPLPQSVSRALELLAQDFRLSPTRRQRLFELASGLSYQAIADRNAISLNTVKSEIRGVLGSLGLMCRHEVDHAVVAACARAEDGRSSEDIYAFLRLRME